MTNLRIFCLIFSLFFTSSLTGKIEVIPEKNLDTSSFMPKQADLRIIFPRPGENKRRNPINIQMRLKNFFLDPYLLEGKNVRIIIDDAPYFSVYQAVNTPHEYPFPPKDQIVSVALPFNLFKGQHLIRSFLCFPNGKSLKKKGCFDIRIFYS